MSLDPNCGSSESKLQAEALPSKGSLELDGKRFPIQNLVHGQHPPASGAETGVKAYRSFAHSAKMGNSSRISNYRAPMLHKLNPPEFKALSNFHVEMPKLAVGVQGG